MANRVVIFESVLMGAAADAVAPVVDDALDAGAASAQRLVPVDTGYLQGQIGVIEGAHREGDSVVGTYGVEDVDYADDVEFGTSKAAAQPYLRPSIDAAAQVLR